MNYHPDLEHLKSRFKIFTNKLLEKAIELEEEAKMSAQDVYNDDPDHYKRAYHQFKLGIEGQFKGLIKKTNDIFNQQIFPLRDTDKYPHNWEWFSELRDQLMTFEDAIQKKMIHVFRDVEEISNEVYLQRILEEYEAIKDAFNCHQCGANLSIDQMYFVATYITCPFCQTQNTFLPGTRMTQLEGLSRDLAEERLKSVENQYVTIKNNSANKLLQISSYLYYRAYVWVEKSKIVPIYTENYLKVFLREVHDLLSGLPSKKLVLKADVYQHVISHLGFKEEMKRMVLSAYSQNDIHEVKSKLNDWEMLLHLSSITITYLFQGVEHQKFHDEQFQRIQQLWTLISKINKALVTNEMELEDAIKALNQK